MGQSLSHESKKPRKKRGNIRSFGPPYPDGKATLGSSMEEIFPVDQELKPCKMLQNQ